MVWVIAGSLALVGLALCLRRLNIPRQRQREGPEDPQVVTAYDRVSRGIILRIARRLALKRLRALHPSGVLLDVGCGPGYLAQAISHELPGLRVIGVDVNDDMLDIAAKNFPGSPGRLEFSKGDAMALPFPDGYADFIVSTGALHHWTDGARPLDEFYRVLKPGGEFLIQDLRRDSRVWFYALARLAQVFMPADIRRVNGAVGSIWASYMPREMTGMLTLSQFRKWEVTPGPGWMFIHGQKSAG